MKNVTSNHPINLDIRLANNQADPLRTQKKTKR